ncbi:DUF928 domain-containing protein [Leptolyngbya sp. FACHB-36]|uniref:DUF928 domain-containing protein n=1 Tax=Leptolyngbya sp. FACHB-36 TaxID=2692808 RepID=UPI0016803848|nr:DUF928 domain-containing protein [Leptolyngbya sp. FACHB-36]MBD2019123.1 DUF928 domain-containing protein [Leptolyngbya sp. FACHB-36]
MNHLLNHFRRPAIVATVLLSLWIAPEALAKYRPPKRPSAPKTTGTNTTRGGSCDPNANSKLTALVPFSHVGQTSSSHPTFAWFVPDRQPYPLQFRLFRSNGQPLYRTTLQSQTGIMQFSLPQTQAGLEIGQSYLWQVVLVCNPAVPLTNWVAAAEIAVVKPDPALQSQLATAQTPQQRSDLYAESGLWYDALAAAYSNRSAVLALLESLASSEAQPLRDWSDRLRQIEAIERQRSR